MKSKIYLLFLFVLGITFYALTLKGIYGNPSGKIIKNNLDQVTKPFELSPERSRYLLTQNLAEYKSFALTKELAEAAYPDVGYYKGRFYIYFAPGISLMALPFYMIGKQFHLAQVSSYFFVSVIASLTLLFLFKISREIFKIPIWISFLASLVFAFASTSWSYAVTMYQHHVTTFFIISSMYAAWKYKQTGKSGFLWGIFIWIAYGLAILIDYPNAILMLPVIFYFFISSLTLIKKENFTKISLRLSFLLTGVIFVIITLLHGYYNYVNFGDWKRVSGSLVGYKTIKEKSIFLQKNSQQQLSSLSAEKNPIGFFKEENFTRGVGILLFSIDRGLFLYSPIFFLAILGIIYSVGKMTIEHATLLGVVALDLFLYGSFGDPWGGYAFGPRYLIPSMAILSIFVAIWLTKTKHTFISKIITFIFFAYSLAISLVGVLTTNAVPPKIEADYFKTYYNFILNFNYLFMGKSSSFLFNRFFYQHVSLIGYYLLIFELIMIIVYITLFIIPLFNKNER